MYGLSWEEICDDVQADGGITFAKGDDDIWVIGWDAGHCWHIPDVTIMDEQRMVDCAMYSDMPFDCYMVDADMAERETRNLARQIAEIKK